jgi:hypothetical protein
MPILSVKTDAVGEAGVVPRLILIETDDTTTEVVVTGYLNKIVAQGIALSPTDMALVSTKNLSPTVIKSSFYNVVFASGDWSLVAI